MEQAGRIPACLFYRRPRSFTNPVSLPVGHFRSSWYLSRGNPDISRCIPIHTCPSNVVCATLVRDRNPPFAPPTVPVIIAAPSITTGGKGLSFVEVTIRSRVFAGIFTDVQAVDPADDPALAIGRTNFRTNVLTNKHWPFASTHLRPGGALTSGSWAALRLRLGRAFSHENPSFDCEVGSSPLLRGNFVANHDLKGNLGLTWQDDSGRRELPGRE